MRKLIAICTLGLATAAFAQPKAAPTKPAAPGKPATPATPAKPTEPGKPAEPAKPAEPPPKLTVAQIMDRQLSNLEREFVPAVEAMPDSKFNFAPTQGEFKGVRTFALQAKHVAQTNTVIFSGLLGEKLPVNIDPKSEDGPAALTSKADVVKFVKDSFALGHRAMATLSEATLTERITDPEGKPGPTRLGAASLTLWHSFDHYGQMVEYLRMNGIVPPASRPQQ
jgi:hypothetical protein